MVFLTRTGSCTPTGRPMTAGSRLLLARALPASPGAGAERLAGGDAAGRARFRSWLHVIPPGPREDNLPPRARSRRSCSLVVDPNGRLPVDPALVAAVLDLSPAQSRVAVLLAEGWFVPDIAVAIGRNENTVRWHIRRTFEKPGIGRLEQLLQPVRSLAGPAAPKSVKRRAPPAWPQHGRPRSRCAHEIGARDGAVPARPRGDRGRALAEQRGLEPVLRPAWPRTRTRSTRPCAAAARCTAAGSRTPGCFPATPTPMRSCATTAASPATRARAGSPAASRPCCRRRKSSPC